MNDDNFTVIKTIYKKCKIYHIHQLVQLEVLQVKILIQSL